MILSSLLAAPQEPATDQHGRAPDKEPKIPVKPLAGRYGLIDVVQAKPVVVKQALNDVEQAEAHEHGAD